jgi:hypothetical protein
MDRSFKLINIFKKRFEISLPWPAIFRHLCHIDFKKFVKCLDAINEYRNDNIKYLGRNYLII